MEDVEVFTLRATILGVQIARPDGQGERIFSQKSSTSCQTCNGPCNSPECLSLLCDLRVWGPGRVRRHLEGSAFSEVDVIFGNDLDAIVEFTVHERRSKSNDFKLIGGTWLKLRPDFTSQKILLLTNSTHSLVGSMLVNISASSVRQESSLLGRCLANTRQTLTCSSFHTISSLSSLVKLVSQY